MLRDVLTRKLYYFGKKHHFRLPQNQTECSMNQKFKSAAVAAILSFTVFLQAQETNSSPEVDSLTTDSIKTLNLKASKPLMAI